MKSAPDTATMNGKPKELKAIARIKVRFHDCDPLGIVWHGNYLKYFEDARDAFGEKYGFDLYSFYEKGYATPLIHSEATYKRPLRYKDIAFVEAHYIKTDAAKIIFHYKIRSEAGDLICTGSTTQVFVTNGTMELALTVPDFVNDWMHQVGLR